MKSILSIIVIAALALLAVSCGPGSGPPDPASAPGGLPEQPSPPGGSPEQPSPQVSLAGTWSGTGMDSNQNTGLAVTIVTWELTQTDASVSGTVTTQSVDTPGTTCNSCHRNKTGTLSGTIAGTKVTLTMSFPGGEGDATPLCTARLTGKASAITQGSLSAVYTGADSCEGPYLDGTLAMAREQ